MSRPPIHRLFAACLSVFALAGAARAADALKVCATVPSLGSIAREVGGAAVDVTVFAKGGENPHFVEARPSFVKSLAGADLFIQQGLELELGWAPVLLQQCRNNKVQPGAPGFVDAGSVIQPLELPSGPVDRSHGDVHPLGNPHYMTDPWNGVLVARLLRDRMAALAPAEKAGFEARCAAFERATCVALLGEKLGQELPVDTVGKLLQLDPGKLRDFLQKQGKLDQLGGWLGALSPFAGTKVVADHNQWIYFGRRFGLEFAGYLEPKPGITPTTSHLSELVQQIPAQQVKLVLASPGFDPKASHFVAEKAGLPLIVLAHEVGAVDGTDSFLKMLDYDVKQVAAALAASAPARKS